LTKERKIKRKKNKETQPILEVSYFGNACYDLVKIWW